MRSEDPPKKRPNPNPKQLPATPKPKTQNPKPKTPNIINSKELKSADADHRRRRLFPALALWETVGLLLLWVASLLFWEPQFMRNSPLFMLTMITNAVNVGQQGSKVKPERAYPWLIASFCIFCLTNFVILELRPHNLITRTVDACGLALFLHIVWMRFQIHFIDVRAARLELPLDSIVAK